MAFKIEVLTKLNQYTLTSTTYHCVMQIDALDCQHNLVNLCPLQMKMLAQLLEPVLKEGEKVLIFTQYVRMVRLLTVMIEKHFQVKPLTLEVGWARATPLSVRLLSTPLYIFGSLTEECS